MPIHIPPQETRRWDGVFPGDYYGTLWKTFNVDLDRHEGKIGLSRRLISVSDTTVIAGLGNVEAFLQSDADCTSRYWALTQNGGLFRASSPQGTWAADSLAGSPTASLRDMAVFENDSTGDTGRQQLFVTTATDIFSLNDTGNRAWDTSWWVTEKSQSALNGAVPHPICYFPFQKMMLIGDGYRVHTFSRTSVTASEATTASRLVFPIDLQIEHIFVTSTRAWFLCANLKGGSGKVVEWDGFSQSPNQIHDIYSDSPLSGVSFYDNPIVLTNRGFFLEYDGRSFTPMIRNGQKISFPIVDEEGNSLLHTVGNGAFNGSPRPRGMAVEGDLIYINIRRPINQSYRQFGGIWCLNPATGRLYVKYALGQWGSLDWGQITPTTAGAIFPLAPGALSRTMLFGGEVTGDVLSARKSFIWVLENNSTLTATKGYFVTQYIHSDEVKDFWDTLWIRFKPFLTSTNRIVVKARGTRPLTGGSNRQCTIYNITWTSGSTFTTTLSASDDALVVGDEVEVIEGDNAGSLAHITTISGAHGAVQTITIDETLNVSANSSRVIFDRWKKLGTISSQSVQEHSLNIGINSSFIQFKVEMRGPAIEMEINDMIVNSTPQIYSKK